MPFRKFAPKSKFRGKRKRNLKKYSNKAKQMVVGHGPTMLENIASGVGSVAKIASAVLPAIMAINTEMKFKDTTAALSAHTPGTSDTISLLTNIDNGTSDNERIGNSALLKSIQIRLAHSFPASVGPPPITGIHCRVMLVCYKANAASAPLTASILFESPTNLYSPINKDNSDLIVVIKDKFFTLNSNVTPSTTQSVGFMAWKYYKDLNWHARWTDLNAETTNHLYLVTRSSATGVTNALSTTHYTRVQFTDN